MAPLRIAQLFNGYRLAWLAVLVAFGLLLWLILARWTAWPLFTEVDPSEVRSSEAEEETQQQPSIEKLAGPLTIEVEQAELSLSSTDGELKMRVWADQARKEGDRYQLDEGALQFSLKDRNTLLLRVTDAEYRLEAGVAHVSGTLIGSIVGTEQYFSAERLSWNQVEGTVNAEIVRYIGPHCEVTGAAMQIDLASGQIKFNGPVQAAI
jgi:hypothetical protein